MIARLSRDPVFDPAGLLGRSDTACDRSMAAHTDVIVSGMAEVDRGQSRHEEGKVDRRVRTKLGSGTTLLPFGISGAAGYGGKTLGRVCEVKEDDDPVRRVEGIDKSKGDWTGGWTTVSALVLFCLGVSQSEVGGWL